MGIISSIWQPFCAIGSPFICFIDGGVGQDTPYVSTSYHQVDDIELRVVCLSNESPIVMVWGPMVGSMGRSFCDGNMFVHFNLVR